MTRKKYRKQKKKQDHYIAAWKYDIVNDKHTFTDTLIVFYGTILLGVIVSAPILLIYIIVKWINS